MSALTITTSPNIASLDSLVNLDLCSGYITVSFIPTVYISTGSANVLGGKVQITNPYGVVVRAFPSTYDVVGGAMDTAVTFLVPTQGGNYQYGKYTIEAQITDADGTTYKVSKTVTICAPNLDKTKNYGTISAKLSGICSAGKLYVLVDNIPNYKGYEFESAVNNFRLDFPTGSGLASLTGVTQPSFSVQLYEGVYKISGTACATYDYGDNVSVKVNYKLNFSKPISCSLDYACVFTGLETLNAKLASDCSEAEKEATEDTIERVTLLLSTIDFGIEAGEDVSDYIAALQEQLELACGCDFNNGTPIINNSPASDILIQGCNVTSEVVGLTKVYTIENYSYTSSVAENGGVLTEGTPTLNGCVYSQTLTFSIDAAYGQIKGLAAADSDFWASVINPSLTGIDATCLGYDTADWTALTFKEKIAAIVAEACAGVDCDATVNTSTATRSNNDVVLAWTETGAYSVDVFVDDILKATVLGNVLTYTLVGGADGSSHTYKLIPKCSNGSVGTLIQNTYNFAAQVFFEMAASGLTGITSPTMSITSGAAYRIEWGDGTNSTFLSGVTYPAHTYAAAYTGPIRLYVDAYSSITKLIIGSGILPASGDRITITTTELSKLTSLNQFASDAYVYLSGMASDLPATMQQLTAIDTNLSGTAAQLPAGLLTLILKGTNSISGNVSTFPTGLTYIIVEGNNTLLGNITGLPRSATLISINGTGLITGSLAGLPPTIVTFEVVGNNTISGNLSTLSVAAGITYLVVYGSNTISGSIASLPAAMYKFAVLGNNTISGALSSIPAAMTIFTVAGSNTLSGNVANVPSLVTSFSVNSTASTINAYTASTKTWPSTMQLVSIIAGSGVLNSTAVDNILVELAAQATTWNGVKQVTIQGGSQARTAASDTAALTTLPSRGVVVITNP